MTRAVRRVAALLATGLLLPVVAVAPASAVTIPTVVTVRAAHHAGYDRLVLQLSARPATVQLGWKTRLTWPQTGKPVAIAGAAFLELHLAPAQAHSNSGHDTIARRTTFALPDLVEMVVTEDFEGHVLLGLGLQRRTPIHVFRLTNPSRVVLDFAVPFATTPVRTYFLNMPRFTVGRTPYVASVARRVLPAAPAAGALALLFAGPTPGERAAGLRLVTSGATGFSALSIAAGVARLRLAGTCNSRGSTFTVADEVIPTLRQFAAVHWVKIYDTLGHTERPLGNSDSIPACLEP